MNISIEVVCDINLTMKLFEIMHTIDVKPYIFILCSVSDYISIRM